MGDLERIGDGMRKVVDVDVVQDTDNVAAIAACEPPRKRARRGPPPGLFEFKKIRSEDKHYNETCFLQCVFPLRHREENLLTWESSNSKGNVRLVIKAGELVNPRTGVLEQRFVPAGPKIRLLVSYINNYIYRNNTRMVPLGESLRGGMKRIGVCVTGPNARELQRELENFFAAKILIIRRSGRSTKQRQALVGHEISFWSERQGQGSLFESSMTVSQEYYDAVMADRHIAPTHWPALIALQHNPLAMDIFSYLCISLFKPLKFPVTVSARELHAIFGQSYTQKTVTKDGQEKPVVKSFWRNFKTALTLAHEWYPHARVELLPHGITLHSSGPVIPRTTQSRQA